MGQAVDIPLVYGPGHYIVMEQGDMYFCREAGVVGDGAGRLHQGTVMTLLKAARTPAGAPAAIPAGNYAPYQDGDDNACILWKGMDARTKGAKATFTMRDTQVQLSALTFVGTFTNAQLQTAISLLAARGIIMR